MSDYMKCKNCYFMEHEDDMDLPRDKQPTYCDWDGHAVNPEKECSNNKFTGREAK